MFFNDRCRDDLDINITNQNVNTNTNMNTNENFAFSGTQEQPYMGGVMSPIIEPGRERIVNRTFIHEVPQE